jgi:tetratricopeptide (TPR) repeat protein
VVAHANLLRAQAVEQMRALERALEHARELGDRALELEIVISSGPPILFGSVPVPDGMRYVDRVLQELGDVPAAAAFAQHVRGHFNARLGRFDEGREEITAWRERFRELGQETMYVVSAGCVWDVCSWAEDWEPAERALRESCEILERMNEKSYLSTVFANLGEAVYRQGRLDEAERYSTLSEELGSSDDLVNEASWRLLRAKVLAARGDLRGAEALARRAVEIAARSDYVETLAGAWLDLAGILGAAGDPGAADAGRQALALFEQKGNLVGARRAEDVLASS